MEDEPTPEKRYPGSTAKLSKTPSWIMLGFLLGAAFVAALPPLKRSAPPARPAEAAPETQSRPEFRGEPTRNSPAAQPPQISRIEAVFHEWRRYAVWAPDDTTQVALWNVEQRAFTEFFEVVRTNNEFYFRTLPTLTRRIMRRGNVPAGCPLEFTETEEQYRDWIERNSGQSPPATVTRPRFAPPRAEPAESPRVQPTMKASDLPRMPAIDPVVPGQPAAPTAK